MTNDNQKLKRLKMGMSQPQLIQTLADANPGGLSVLLRVLQQCDCQTFCAVCILLDVNDIIGEDIWELWQQAGQDMATFLELLSHEGEVWQ